MKRPTYPFISEQICEFETQEAKTQRDKITKICKLCNELSILNELEPFFNINENENKITMNGFANGFRMPFMTEMFLIIKKNISNLATDNYLDLPINPCKLDELMIFIDVEKIAKSHKRKKEDQIHFHKEICESLDKKELLFVHNASLPDYHKLVKDGFPKETISIPFSIPFDVKSSNRCRLAVSPYEEYLNPLTLFFARKRDSFSPMQSPKFSIGDISFDDSLHRLLKDPIK